MAKNIEGVCALCGKHKKLTFEHVPPESVFNDFTVKVYPFEETVKMYTGSDGRMPWDFEGLYGKLNQRGSGDYVLCPECNSNTGAWYISEYSKFANTLHNVIASTKPNPGERLSITLERLYPQRIFKAILTMFCDINKGCFGDESLRAYILDRNSTNINLSKYTVCLYLVDGHMRRIQDLCAISRSDVGLVLMSEIASYPVGLLLYIDPPCDLELPGLCINDFATRSYDDLCNLEFVGVPYLSINSLYPGDFRTKAKIISDKAQTGRKIMVGDDCMETIKLRYGVCFGKGEGSDWLEYEHNLTEEQVAAYHLAVKMRKPLDSVDELAGILEIAYKEIEEEEIENLCAAEDEYVLGCQGRIPMDTDRLNELVHNADPYTLEFLELQDLSPEELEDWDADCDLDELPLICDFDQDFKPCSPFDGGYSLFVEFVDPNEDEWLEEEEAEQTIRELFAMAPGDFSLVLEYIKINGEDYGEEELKEVAIRVAGELEIAGFASNMSE